MSRMLVSSMISVVLLCVGVGQASAAGSKIAKAMGDLRWGMSEGEVINFVQRQLDKKYKSLIRAQKDMRRETDLREELREKKFAVRKSLVEFNGGKSNWDVSNVAGEYTHGNSESMLVAKDRDSSTYYFFIEGRLWKWIKTYDSEVFGGKNFKKFQKLVGKKFGRGRVKSGKRNDERGKQRWVEYMDRNSRMRAVDDTDFYGKYALVFEDKGTVRDLATLRANTIKRKKKVNRAVAGLSRDFKESDSEGGVVDKITGKDRRNAGKVSRKKRRKSLFDDDKQAESEAEYEARAKKAEAAERAKQRRAFLRKQRKKNAKALDGVPAADEDDDPLSGL
ncbi:MAG: hypothetical protein OXU20_23295 [Myxococcales bacterium]|nr:hypothetical protein [Myxococcales bacterium]MDD9968876.1 hypothetical protein [Myxococcales bacterium]